jgi:hypothetical protein
VLSDIQSDRYLNEKIADAGTSPVPDAGMPIPAAFALMALLNFDSLLRFSENSLTIRMVGKQVDSYQQ